MREKYEVGQRIEFMARAPKMTLNGNIVSVGSYRQIVGYVKRVTKNWLGQTRYIVCDASKDSLRTIYYVKPSNIFGIVEKKDKPMNK